MSDAPNQRQVLSLAWTALLVLICAASAAIAFATLMFAGAAMWLGGGWVTQNSSWDPGWWAAVPFYVLMAGPLVVALAAGLHAYRWRTRKSVGRLGMVVVAARRHGAGRSGWLIRGRVLRHLLGGFRQVRHVGVGRGWRDWALRRRRRARITGSQLQAARRHGGGSCRRGSLGAGIPAPASFTLPSNKRIEQSA